MSATARLKMPWIDRLKRLAPAGIGVSANLPPVSLHLLGVGLRSAVVQNFTPNTDLHTFVAVAVVLLVLLPCSSVIPSLLLLQFNCAFKPTTVLCPIACNWPVRHSNIPRAENSYSHQHIHTASTKSTPFTSGNPATGDHIWTFFSLHLPCHSVATSHSLFTSQLASCFSKAPWLQCVKIRYDIESVKHPITTSGLTGIDFSGSPGATSLYYIVR